MSPNVQAELEAVLRGIEERTLHEEDCIQLSQARFTGGGHEFTVSCNCGHAARVRAEQARTVERMVEAAIRVAGSWTEQVPDAAWAAALRAVAPQ